MNTMTRIFVRTASFSLIAMMAGVAIGIIPVSLPDDGTSFAIAFAAYGQPTDTSGNGSGSNGGSPIGAGKAGTPPSDNGSGAGGGVDEAQGTGGTPQGGGGGTGGGGGSGGGGEEPVVGNNLSFPLIAADGYSITALDETSLHAVYDGPYTRLSDEEKDLLVGYDWYAQKTEGNLWQADYVLNQNGEEVSVFGVDWGDNVEAVQPVVGRPFRLEVTLYHKPEETMLGYTMALLAFPSSPNEVQGTNGRTYDGTLATIVSEKPRFVVQALDDGDVETLVWTGSAWTRGNTELPVSPLSFGPELNVGGKYIYGASKGGWKPREAGMYRLTFYLPESDISLANASIGNYADWIAVEVEPSEDDGDGGAAVPKISAEHNITYVDVEVVDARTGRKPENPGEDGESDTGETTTVSALTSVTPTDALRVPVTADATCEPYLTDYMGEGLDNDPTQVILLQTFLNETIGSDLPLTGYFGPLTTEAVQDFQEMYATDILLPWDASLTEGTGYVYVTTLAKINSMKCM